MTNIHHQNFPYSGTIEAQVDVLLEYAIRAPSTHNIQPWLFVRSEDSIDLYLDTSRKLVQADPTGRDAFISLGACLEHLVVAAKYFGMFEKLKISNFFASDKPVAQLFFHTPKDSNTDMLPFITAIEGRFNARGPFEDRKVPKDILDEMLSFGDDEGVKARLLEDSEKEIFADLVAKGMRIVHSKREFRRELSNWMHNNYSSRMDGIPGYTMLAPNILSLFLPFIIRTFNMGGVLSKLNLKSINSAPAAAILTTSDDSEAAWLRTGMLFEHTSLFLAAHDVRTSIYVAAIEVPELRVELSKKLSLGQKPQFAFTFGYPKIQIKQSPRIPATERMKAYK